MMTFLTRLLAVIGVAAIVGGVDSLLRPISLAPAAPMTPVAPSPDGRSPAPARPQGVNITLEQAFEMFNQGAAFVDARSKTDFEAGRIFGALHQPAGDDLRVEVLGAIGDPTRAVVVYCGGGDCTDSKLLTLKLQERAGFTNVRIFEAGYPAWVAAGHPTEAGPRP